MRISKMVIILPWCQRFSPYTYLCSFIYDLYFV